jgi:hypothetical protein
LVDRVGYKDFIQKVAKHYRLSFFTSSSYDYAQEAHRKLDGELNLVEKVYCRNDVRYINNMGTKPLTIVLQYLHQGSELTKLTKQRVLLFDDDPYYVTDDFRFNVLRSNRLTSYYDEMDHPRLDIFGDLLVYLSKCEDVSEKMQELHQIWFEKELITYAPDAHKGSSYL